MTLRRPTTMAYAAVLASVVALSACTGSSNDPGPTGTPPPASTPASTPPTSSSAAPSTSSTATESPSATTPAGPTFPKGVPTAAQKHTKEGAKAFVTYFIKQLNASWTVPDPTLLIPLCKLPGSKSCAAYVTTATKLKSKGQKYDGDPLSVQSLIVLAPEGDQTPVLMNGFQNRRNVVSKNGDIILTDQREPSRAIYALSWSDSGWIVDTVKLVKP